MLKYARIIGLIGLSFLLFNTHAAAAVKVLVLPFDIYAQEDLAYLKTEIPRTITNDLKQEDIEIIEIEALAGLSDKISAERGKGVGGIRNIGMFSGADYIVWGSLTRIGQKFSVDAKLLEVIGSVPPNTYFVEGTGIENLLLKVKQLAARLTLKFFKREIIADIQIKGQNRIEADAIKRKIKTRAGDVYLLKRLTEDLKAVYSMGYFDDIRIETEKGPKGKIIIFTVKEKPTIRAIRIKGNAIIDDKKIKENLTIKTGSILNIYKIQKNIGRIEALYKEKHYHNIQVEHKTKPRPKNQADLEFIITEGKKTHIKKIQFVGNRTVKSRKLKKLMTTSEKGLFSFFTSSGELKKENLSKDTDKITAYYHNNGYIQAKVGEPQIEFKDHWITITIKVEEGKRFKVGTVALEGDLIRTAEELKQRLKITQEAFYNREIVRKDLLMLSDLYADEGYARAGISPKVDQDTEAQRVNITFMIEKGPAVYFEKILISGNTSTRDKVIRRELKIYEQELFSGSRLKRGMRNLYRLNYFQDIKVDTRKGSADDKMILKIEVEEKPTGAFSFGGGYSTVDNFFLTVALEKRNFLGRGQTVAVKGTLGGRSSRFTLSFTEPWLFDIPLSAGADLYNQTFDYDAYDKDSVGAKIRFGYPLHDFVRLYLSYGYDISDVHDIESYASSQIKDIEGENATSKVSTTLRYDSRDLIFNATEGSDHRVTVQYAGLGGDFAYTKVEADTGWYFPLWGDTIGFIHAKTGYVTENSGGKLPDFERFYLGGMNSIRGYGWHDISTKDADGADIGGEKMVQFNIEYQVPLFKEAGIVGVIFYDTGNVYGVDEDIELSQMHESTGAGIRWYSPVGPIRLEYGYRLNEKAKDGRGGRWEFSMGMSFF